MSALASTLSVSRPQRSLPATVSTELLDLSTTWVNPDVVRITAAGDIDASNADEFARYVFRRGANAQRLILDLQDVEFFSTAGFSVLYTVNERCAQATVNWMVIGSRAVGRVLEICDPHGALPVAKS